MYQCLTRLIRTASPTWSNHYVIEPYFPPPIEKTPWNVFANISMPLNTVLSKMERKGIDYNREYQTYLEEVLNKERDKTYAEAKELMWQEVFPNPPASIEKLSTYLKELLL